MAQSELTFTERPTVVRLRLTHQQTKEITPLVHKAAVQRENVLFVAVAGPSWSPEDGAVIWEFQASLIRAKCGERVKKLILDSAA
jgi:hypothetical protein